MALRRTIFYLHPSSWAHWLPTLVLAVEPLLKPDMMTKAALSFVIFARDQWDPFPRSNDSEAAKAISQDDASVPFCFQFRISFPFLKKLQ